MSSASIDGGRHMLLLDLELRLMDPAFRRDRIRVSELLADEFREFGSSGRVWTKATMLDLLGSESDYTPPSVQDFTAQRVGEETVLVTYRTVRPGSSSLRSSIWILRDGRWQVLFHQGTPVSS